ncbi:uncharacterized protein DDB_G0272530 isoform X2 [Monomorium pharaonis]|uniref:uncharacterized protein DDB_G0272530 isoform X2 n=1 Tax=Monomorium pharaonis TaxID=307658 RepID=UPI001746835E|nr:uncharacterized protein DDB_G0272530 isoform X2 [Monomorium pharaonis]
MCLRASGRRGGERQQTGREGGLRKLGTPDLRFVFASRARGTQRSIGRPISISGRVARTDREKQIANRGRIASGEEMSPAGMKMMCLILVAIGLTNGDKIGPLVYRTCKHEQDCKFPGGTCNSTIRQCVCLKNFVPSSNKQSCVSKADSIEASCTDENQCLAFSANTTCENGKCVCISGHHYIDNACWKTVGYNESCTKNQECSHIQGGVCNDNMTCRCAAEMVLNTTGDKCLAAAKNIQDECVESIQCTATFEFSVCVANKCQCEQSFHYEHELTRCFPNKAIDEECANNYECYQAEDYENDPPIKSVICDSNRCTCADNFVLSENKCVTMKSDVSAGSSFALALSLIVPVIALTFLS